MSAAAALRPSAQLDEVTLARAQRGDERAWRDLIDRYQQPVYALVWRLLAGRAKHRAEDLAQETFVRVLRGLPDFDPRGPATLQTWILAIAARVALNELRRPEAAAADRAPEPIARERADAQTERARLGAAIADGVAALPEAQRAVFVLREYHDMDYVDIAVALEIDLGTVKSRLARARTALRAHLDALGVGHG